MSGMARAYKRLGFSLGYGPSGEVDHAHPDVVRRVQEQVATLSWFYANERAWNPYYGDEVLLARLDEAIGHYLSLQHANGSFSEYNLPEQSRAATGFGLTALTETLENLRAIDALPDTQTALEEAIRRAAHWVLDLDSGVQRHDAHRFYFRERMHVSSHHFTKRL